MNFLLLLVVISQIAQPEAFINPILLNGRLFEPLEITINETVEYIIQYDSINSSFPLRVQTSSEDAQKETPMMVVVRQKKEVLSWSLPMYVDGNNGGSVFKNSARTLCYDTTIDNRTLQDALEGTRPSLLNDFHVVLEDSPIISISTSSPVNVTATILLDVEGDFYINPNVDYTILVTPSTPRVYFYDFPDNATIKDNTKTVVLEVYSPDSICMTVSIQNASCPVYDLNHNIKFEGYWETVNMKGGITISKTKFPNGFFVVFVPKPDDFDCTGELVLPITLYPNRNKTITYRITPSIAYTDYANAILATAMSILLFYIVFGIGFFMCSSRAYIPRSMEYMTETADNTPTTLNTEHDFTDNISFDETEYDTMAEACADRETILNKPVVYLSDLARKDIRILKKKSYSYLWHVLTVAVFYGLPVIQLVITYQKVLNDTGNQDLCYYNFLCAHPFGFFSDFNHLFSNVGYIFFGLLYLWIVYRREKWHQDMHFDQQYGIPQHYGLFYALGVALIMEGVLSGSYHICPNHSNFQFDTSFMYVMAVLCMVKIYQTRHPDINATAYSTFGVLAVAILLGMLGIMQANLYFWIAFTILHIITGFYLTSQIYYMGCWKLDRWFVCKAVKNMCTNIWTRNFAAFKPKYTGRFVLLLIGNICNWALAVVGVINHERDFAMYLLGIFMMNTLLYFVFYIVMKLLHRERINLIAFFFLIISLTCAASALYCFLNRSISWSLTPAESRRFNQDCKLMRFYDYHDIWHFLSAVGMFFIFMVLLLLDEDLSHTHRSKIHVF